MPSNARWSGVYSGSGQTYGETLTLTEIEVKRSAGNTWLTVRGKGPRDRIEVRLPDAVAVALAGMLTAVASGAIEKLSSPIK